MVERIFTNMSTEDKKDYEKRHRKGKVRILWVQFEVDGTYTMKVLVPS